MVSSMTARRLAPTVLLCGLAVLACGASLWAQEAASIEITPVEATNPMRTQHTLIATVRDAVGGPLGNRRVEWILARAGDLVGDIVEIDNANGEGRKIDNHYAITHTASQRTTVVTGSGQEIPLDVGQTWITITSTRAGDTDIIAFAPSIADKTKHKTFAVKHWMDVTYEMPEDATNKIGQPHALPVKVWKFSDRTPLAGFRVEWKLRDDLPNATLGQGDEDVATGVTDAQGVAIATLRQVDLKPGDNTVRIRIFTPDGLKQVASHEVRKTWLAPVIGIRKTAAERLLLGDSLLYQITVSNDGQAPAEDVVVRDELPAGVRCETTKPRADVAGQVVTWRLGALAPGDVRELSALTVPQQVGRLVNPATVTTKAGLTARDTAETVVVQPKLALTKSGPRTLVKGEQGTYTLRVSNPGSGEATNVVVTDVVPTGMSSAEGKRIEWPVGTLTPGQSADKAIVLTADRPGKWINAAEAVADRNLKAMASTETVVVEPKLTITKTAPAKRFVNSTMQYALRVSNPGTTEATNVVVVDRLPQGALFVSCSDGGRYEQTAHSVTWQLGNLLPGGSKSVSIDVKCSQIATYVNVATATADRGLEDKATAKTVVLGRIALHIDDYDTQDPVSIGEETTYVITIKNEGSATATKVELVNTIPEQMSYVSATGPTGAPVIAGRKLAFNPIAKLDPGEEAEFRVTCKGAKAGEAVNDASFFCAEFRTPVRSQEGTRVYAEE